MSNINIALNKTYFSSREHQDFPAHKAFDGNKDKDDGWRTTETGTQYVGVDLGESFIVTDISLYQMDHLGDARARNFNLYGSNNNIDYDLIFSGELENTFNNAQNFKINEDNERYRYLKFEFTSYYGVLKSVGIAEIEVYGIPNKTLILSEEQYYTFTEKEWVNVGLTLTQELINSHGMTKDELALIPEEAFDLLEEPSLVQWRPESEDTYDEKDQLSYRVMVNGEEAISWVALSEAPLKIDEVLPNHLFFIGENIISIEYKDDLGAIKTMEKTIEKVFPKTFLIEEDEKIKAYQNNEWVTIGNPPVTIEMFDHGIENVSLEAINKLSDHFTIHYHILKDDEEKQIELNAIPKPHLILPTSDINLQRIENIDEFRLIANTEGEGIVRVIVSFDKGQTWHTYQGEEWHEIDIDNFDQIESLGIKPESLELIPSSAWSELRGGSLNVRFGYLLNISNIDDVAETDELISQVDMRGIWDKALESEARYSYVDNSTLMVRIYKNGTYKVNY